MLSISLKQLDVAGQAEGEIQESWPASLIDHPVMMVNNS